MKKRVTACMTAACLAATTVGAAVGLTGCGKTANKYPTEGSSDPTASINILLLANSTEIKFYNSYFAKQAEKYNVNIEFEGLPASSYYDRLGSLTQQNKLPDIFYVRPNEILKYHSKIYSLEKFMENFDENGENENLRVNTSKIYDLALDLYKYNDQTKQMDEKNGEQYAFPKDLSTQQLGYNKLVVQQYATQIQAADAEKGGKLKLPWNMNFETENYTWKDYRTMCEIISTEAYKAKATHYGCDIPSIEILANSYNGRILNTETMKVEVTSSAVQQAIQYQKDLITPSKEGNQPAASRVGATQQAFTRGEVAFYGALGSWEVGDYDTADKVGKGNWDVMPWPTVDGSTNWKGLITSAGYVVSNQCKNWQAAMEIAASFMTRATQELLVREKVSIPMNSDVRNVYLTGDYTPLNRKVFIDVISGTHGFRPATYYTFGSDWLDTFSERLEIMYKGQGAPADYAITDSVQKSMQETLDDYKYLIN